MGCGKYDAVKAPQVDAGRELIAMAKVRERDSILDLGCGTGKLTVELAKLASNGHVTGLDPSHEMLEKAHLVSAGMENMILVHVPAQSMNFEDRFDLVFSNSALQWIKEQKKVIELVFQSLKQGGRTAFQLPAKDFCREFFEYSGHAVASSCLGRFFADWESPWYLPSKDEYETLLEDAGFRNINVFYKDYRLMFVCVKEVLDWWASAGLRPFIERLPEREQAYFKYAFAMSFEKNRTEHGIEFNFRRLFAFGEKQ